MVLCLHAGMHSYTRISRQRVEGGATSKMEVKPLQRIFGCAGFFHLRVRKPGNHSRSWPDERKAPKIHIWSTSREEMTRCGA
jgi:hypothetical protein